MKFRPGIAQVLAAGLYDDPAIESKSARQIADDLIKRMERDGFVKYVATINHVSRRELRGALDRAEDDFPKHLAAIIAELRSIPAGVTHRGLPSKACLARLGLAGHDPHTAWGFCYVRTENVLDEIVMRYSEKATAYAKWNIPLDEAIAGLLHSTEETAHRTSASLLDAQMVSAYLVAAASGFRYFSVWGGCLHELSANDLTRDIDARQLRDLSIAGVNAPDIFAACS